MAHKTLQDLIFIFFFSLTFFFLSIIFFLSHKEFTLILKHMGTESVVRSTDFLAPNYLSSNPSLVTQCYNLKQVT